MGDGPGAEAGRCGCERRCREGLCANYSRPVLPVAEAVDDDELNIGDQSADELNAPLDEEEQAEMPLCLPSVYQPTRSEYMDHCTTHYPYRAWCKHCLEGRGREFGHDNH